MREGRPLAHRWVAATHHHGVNVSNVSDYTYILCPACACAHDNGDPRYPDAGAFGRTRGPGVSEAAAESSFLASIEAASPLSRVRALDMGGYFQCFACDEVCIGSAYEYTGRAL